MRSRPRLIGQFARARVRGPRAPPDASAESSLACVLVVGGATGTLNEFTIAYDEGKIIGVLEESGGIAARIRDIIQACNKPTLGKVFFDRDPIKLVAACVAAIGF